MRFLFAVNDLLQFNQQNHKTFAVFFNLQKYF